jgi:16S rRNA (cytosine967-C5)-methyltransferase
MVFRLSDFNYSESKFKHRKLRNTTKSQSEKMLSVKQLKISPARLSAFEILLKIESEKAFSSVLLPLYGEKLSTKDRALCHTITLGVLRKKLFLDRVIEELTKKKMEKFDLAVLLALRIGLFQVLFLDKIPAHAAINESVNLVHLAKKRSAAGLVNAVLRRAARDEIKTEFADEIEKLSVETSHPRWLIEHWIKQFGLEETEKLTVANNETPRLVFRLTKKSDEKTIETLRKLGLEIDESAVVANAYEVLKSNEILHLYATEGKIYFHEEASQLVAKVVHLQPDDNFLDVCAAPGSKTTLINYKLQTTNYELQPFVAGDRYLHRLRVLRETCERVGAENVNIIAYDAEKSLPFAAEGFGVVLVDAPCSGSGTIRHNPEIRYFLRREDFTELSAKQLRILENASKVVKTGGRLIYSTCSLEREENEAVCERFLAKQTDFEKVSPALPGRFLTEEGFARTFPQKDKTDGFFIAVFEKK